MSSVIVAMMVMMMNLLLQISSALGKNSAYEEDKTIERKKTEAAYIYSE